jgi:serine/threonine protein kinase/Flp pilus assembly protein TadD
MIAETIAHYRVLSQLGGEGAGAVYSAEDLHLGRHVALKFLSTALESPGALDQFERETRIVSALHHPNICEVYEVGESDARHFVAMELLEGQTLKRRLDGQPVENDFLLRVALQIADALDATHAKGVLHGDLRPGNIFITGSGQTKILNFGSAQQACEKRTTPEDTTRGTAVTASRGSRDSAVSRIAYQSPEQARGQQLDARSDLFSLGIVLYEMATGTIPFRGETPAVVFDALLNRIPVTPSRLNPELPPKLQQIICKLLEKKRSSRYQSARELRADLERLSRDGSSVMIATAKPASSLPALAYKAASPGRLGKYLSALGLLAAVIAGGAFLYSKRERGLSEKDAILLTDFVNTTADPVWDAALKKAVAVDLEQSPYLNVFPEGKARQTLRFMGHPQDERINVQTGREICQRAGVKAMLTGTIGNLGSQYVLTVEALNAATGDVLARAEAQAPRREDVLNALHKADSDLRAKLGESLQSVQQYNKMVSEATTPSLEALNAFTQGDTKHSAGNEIGAVVDYQRAVQLDPNFATAYARLGTVYSNLGQTALAEENRQRAFELRDRTSEREKLYIMSHYYADSGQFDKGITALELYEQTYPRDSIPANNLANIYNQLGQFENALDKARKAVDLEPDSISGYDNLAMAYAGLNRMEEAKATAVEGLKRAPQNSSLHAILAGIAWNQKDAAAMEQELTATESSGPDGQLMALSMRADLAAAHGQFKQMRSLTQKLQEASSRSNLDEAAAGAEAQRAVWEALVGFAPLARQLASHAMQGRPPVHVALNAAVCMALLRQDDEALKIASEVALERPFDTIAQFVTIPTVKAIVALHHDQPKKAIDLLDGAMVYGRANTGLLYARGMTYLEAKQGAQAVQEFQRVVDMRSINMDPITSLAKLGLARAYAVEGDKTNSRMAYQDFLALWNNADPDVPLLKQVKAEYATVQ